MTYYMTGTGGKLWKSKDLRYWDGPYTVAETDPESWMGPKPMIWAAELHQYKGEYYYFATFTNQAVSVGRYKGNNLEPVSYTHLDVYKRQMIHRLQKTVSF